MQFDDWTKPLIIFRLKIVSIIILSGLYFSAFVPLYRLVNNNSNEIRPNSGLLEFFNVYWNHTKGIGGYDWIPHCIATFNISIADYYCRKLGYSHAERYGTVRALGWVD